MARMHTRRRGQSGSKRPPVKANPAWVQLGKAEIEERIVKLHGEGLSGAVIGLRLRDQFGVPNVRLATGKSVLQILKEKGVKLEMPEDMAALLRRSVQLQIHLKTNRADTHNKRSLSLTVAKIRRLADYYKREGVLPVDWDFTVKSAELQAQ